MDTIYILFKCRHHLQKCVCTPLCLSVMYVYIYILGMARAATGPIYNLVYFLKYLFKMMKHHKENLSFDKMNTWIKLNYLEVTV
uniref:Putative ovule protein n=1 Tax=Solanum chacoense TaxID=4108 RepID=A0A0V0H5E0_SOLCH